MSNSESVIRDAGDPIADDEAVGRAEKLVVDIAVSALRVRRNRTASIDDDAQRLYVAAARMFCDFAEGHYIL